MKVSIAVAALLIGSSWLLAQDDKKKEDIGQKAPSLFPEGYLDHEALTAALKRVADEHPRAVKVTSLAKTATGRDVWLATLGRPPAQGEPPKPAILVVGNLEADHLVGSQVALGFIERLAKANGDDRDVSEMLDRATIYVVPRLNPDGAERLFARPLAEFRNNLRPLDRDRDGRQGEDGPDDLDGDGVITRMRAKDGKATLIADSKDARILRKADSAKGERAVFSEHAEGVDNDGDGQVNEDGPGGVNLNRNWPHRWTEFDAEAGFSPASEPEVFALIKFACDHPEIAVVWSFGLNDNLKTEPRKPGSTLDDADLPYFAELSRLANKGGSSAAGASKREGAEPTKKDEASKTEEPKVAEVAKEKAAEERAKAASSKGQEPPAGQTKGQRGGGRGGPAGSASSSPTVTPALSSGLEGTTDGALSEWVYHQFGIVGLASRLWSSPDIPDESSRDPKPPADGEARWLYWNDHIMDGRAFVALHTFKHPTLGEVEVGGWRPGVRVNPPSEHVAAIADEHYRFLKELAKKLPALAISDAKVEPRGGGLYQITATVANEGYLPTALVQGVRTRKASPVLVRLKVGEGKILAGKALNRIDALAGSGGRQEYRWLVMLPEGTRSITLEATTAKAGRASKTIELK